MTNTGRMLWKTPLETRDTLSSPAVVPVAAGPVAVFAQDGIVHGILPARGLLGGQALTADGGLAMAVIGHGLQVVNLADGRVRWQLRIPASPALTAVGGLVIYGLDGHLTGYDARTGAPRWTITRGVPHDPHFSWPAASSWLPARPAAPRYRTP